MNPKTVLSAAVVCLLVASDRLPATTITVYDRDTGDRVREATIYIETDPVRLRVRNGKTNEDGVYDAETGGSLLAACEKKVEEEGVKLTCRLLIVTAVKGGKSAEATIKRIGDSWDPVHLTLSIGEAPLPAGYRPGFTTVCPWAYHDKLFWRITPLYVREVRWVACASAGGTILRPVVEWRLVGVRRELVPASQVPPGASISPTMPVWAIPRLEQQPYDCAPALP